MKPAEKKFIAEILKRSEASKAFKVKRVFRVDRNTLREVLLTREEDVRLHAIAITEGLSLSDLFRKGLAHKRPSS